MSACDPFAWRRTVRPLAGAAWVAAACSAQPGASPGPVVGADPCVVARDTAAPRLDTVTVAVADEVAPGPGRWPFAGAAIERQLDPTPIPDCLGRSPDRLSTGGGFEVRRRSAGEIVIAPTDSTLALRVRYVAWPTGADPRDALDGSAPNDLPRIDVLVTRDPSAIAFAGSRAEFTVRALAWDRTYVLVGAAATPPDSATAAELARYALRAEARPAQRPSWWEADPRCATPAPPDRTGLAIVAHAANDPIARGLAGRLVALAAMTPAPAWLGRLASPRARAVAVEAAAVDSVLGTGAALAAVAAWPLAPSDCGALTGVGMAGVVPLVDSRAHLVIRRGAPSLVVDGAGTFRFPPENRR